jgi:ubiquinone/menaquinone biosynthesis C-methylase UbiE
MDANALAFPDGMFDLCFGSGVIHHLRLPEALGEIRRVLKIGGTMIFLEPLATNAVIELYRRLTPKDRTADETPLTAAHLDELRRRFRDVKLEYFGFFTLSEMALAKWPRIQDFLHMIARRLDRILFRVPGGWRLAWVVVIVART